jgi:hypothetical protein
MVIEKNQKQFYNPLVIRNLTIFVILFCDVYEGKEGEWDCGTDLAHRGQGYSNTLELWLK